MANIGFDIRTATILHIINNIFPWYIFYLGCDCTLYDGKAITFCAAYNLQKVFKLSNWCASWSFLNL